MKKFRKFAQSPTLIALLCSGFLFVSCFKEQQAFLYPQFSGKELMAAIYFADGPALEVLPEIKNSVNISLFISTDSELLEIRKAYGELLDKLEEMELGAFDDFKNKIESRNHVIIEATIKIYAAKISRLLNNEYADTFEYRLAVKNQGKFIEIISRYTSQPSNQYTVRNTLDNSEFIQEISTLLDGIKNHPSSGKVSASEKATCVVLFAGLAAWVVVWWAVLAWTFFWTGTNYDWDFDGNYAIVSEGGLLKDQIINSLATNLH